MRLGRNKCFPIEELLLPSDCLWPDSAGVHVYKLLIIQQQIYNLLFSSCHSAQKKLFNKKEIVKECDCVSPITLKGLY